MEEEKGTYLPNSHTNSAIVFHLLSLLFCISLINSLLLGLIQAFISIYLIAPLKSSFVHVRISLCIFSIQKKGRRFSIFLVSFTVSLIKPRLTMIPFFKLTFYALSKDGKSFILMAQHSLFTMNIHHCAVQQQQQLQQQQQQQQLQQQQQQQQLQQQQQQQQLPMIANDEKWWKFVSIKYPKFCFYYFLPKRDKKKLSFYPSCVLSFVRSFM